MIYEFPILLDLGETIPEVGDLVKNLNDGLATLGVSDHRLVIASEITSCCLESSRHLTDRELSMIRDEVQACARQSFTQHNVSVGEPRCQSGKVQQSVE